MDTANLSSGYPDSSTPLENMFPAEDHATVGKRSWSRQQKMVQLIFSMSPKNRIRKQNLGARESGIGSAGKGFSWLKVRYYVPWSIRKRII